LGKVKTKPEKPNMDFDEVMRRVVRVAPEKPKKARKRKSK
jgi:hypothetical protein